MIDEHGAGAQEARTPARDEVRAHPGAVTVALAAVLGTLVIGIGLLQPRPIGGGDAGPTASPTPADLYVGEGFVLVLPAEYGFGPSGDDVWVADGGRIGVAASVVSGISIVDDPEHATTDDMYAAAEHALRQSSAVSALGAFMPAETQVGPARRAEGTWDGQSMIVWLWVRDGWLGQLILIGLEPDETDLERRLADSFTHRMGAAPSGAAP